MFLPGVKCVSSTEKWNLSDMLLLHVIRTLSKLKTKADLWVKFFIWTKHLSTWPNPAHTSPTECFAYKVCSDLDLLYQILDQRSRSYKTFKKILMPYTIPLKYLMKNRHAKIMDGFLNHKVRTKMLFILMTLLKMSLLKRSSSKCLVCGQIMEFRYLVYIKMKIA